MVGHLLFSLSSHTVCTPFGLSTMFTVTGKLLVKPRVRHHPTIPLPPDLGVAVPRAAIHTAQQPLTGSSPTLPAPGGPG